jgi:SAM-dependent methyltransferase
MQTKDKIANFFGKRLKNIKSGAFGRERFLLTRLAYLVLPSLGYSDYSRGKEWDFVMGNLIKPPARVLDAGCARSLLMHELAHRGYETFGLDFTPYVEKLPKGAQFIKGDILHTPFEGSYFDCVIAVSFIEHVGTGEYDAPIHDDGDLRAIAEIYRITKPHGILLLTIPSKEWAREFELKNNIVADFRGYNDAAIERLIKGHYTILKKEFRMGQHLLKLQKI